MYYKIFYIVLILIYVIYSMYHSTKGIKLFIDWNFKLFQAKKFVESAPVVVKSDLTKDEANQLMEKLNSIGAECIVE